MADETQTTPDLQGISPDALPPTGAADYLSKMVARADAAQGRAPEKAAAEVTPAKEPAPEKPAPQVDWEKRYKDAQAALTKAQQELADRKKTSDPVAKDEPKAKAEGEPEKADAEAKPEDAPKAETPPEAKEAKELTDRAGLDWNAVNEEFAREGKLSDDSYEALSKIGIAREMVDAYTEGQVAIQQQRRNEVLSTVGGAEEYAKVTRWAASSLSKDEVDGFNAIVNGSDLKATKAAIAGLHARYMMTVGREPALVTGTTSNTTTGYASMAELKSAIRDPRYATDRAYRDQVETKLRMSQI